MEASCQNLIIFAMIVINQRYILMCIMKDIKCLLGPLGYKIKYDEYNHFTIFHE